MYVYKKRLLNRFVLQSSVTFYDNISRKLILSEHSGVLPPPQTLARTTTLAGGVARVARPTGQQRFEGTPEVPVAERVDDWVKYGVKVPNPEEGGNYILGGGDLVLPTPPPAAHCGRHVPRKERQPTEQERTHYYPESFGRLVFPLKSSALVGL